MTRERNTQTIYFVVVGALLAVIFFYFSRRVLTPFFIAFALAYLLDPVTDRLESLKISRTFLNFSATEKIKLAKKCKNDGASSDFSGTVS